MQFAYDQAFDRNVGWLTEWEQQALRGKRVAIAGLGGVGGAHPLTLVRFTGGAPALPELRDLVEQVRRLSCFGGLAETEAKQLQPLAIKGPIDRTGSPTSARRQAEERTTLLRQLLEKESPNWGAHMQDFFGGMPISMPGAWSVAPIV